MIPDIAGFTIRAELPGTTSGRVFEAHRQSGSDAVRLTLLNAELSQQNEFRRAFKTDRAMLLRLRHQAIPRYLETGEHDGALFYTNEAADARTLADWLRDARQFAIDDLIEIGWQVCSALQHAHNLGFSHGDLNADCLLLTDNLQVFVIDFGLSRWRQAAATSQTAPENSAHAFATQADIERDLSGLAEILQSLLQLAAIRTDEDSSTERSNSVTLLNRLLARALNATDPSQRPVSAREFQGRLGELLLGTSADELPLLDERRAIGGTRRSIVYELFDDASIELPNSDDPGTSASPAPRSQILPIALLVLGLIVLLVLAGWLW